VKRLPASERTASPLLVAVSSSSAFYLSPFVSEVILRTAMRGRPDHGKAAMTNRLKVIDCRTRPLKSFRPIAPERVVPPRGPSGPIGVPIGNPLASKCKHPAHNTFASESSGPPRRVGTAHLVTSPTRRRRDSPTPRRAAGSHGM